MIGVLFYIATSLNALNVYLLDASTNGEGSIGEALMNKNNGAPTKRKVQYCEPYWQDVHCRAGP